MSPPMAPGRRFVLRGGTIHDPLHDRDGVVDDLWIDGGTIVPRPAVATGFAVVDATGLVVMPGGSISTATSPGPR